MKRLLPYVLYLLLIACYETLLRPQLNIVLQDWSFSINLTGLLITLIPMYKSEGLSLWFGFTAGLVLGATRPDVVGWIALVSAMTALAVFHLRDRVNFESLMSRLLVILGAVAVHNVLTLLILGEFGSLELLLTHYLPGAVYTSFWGYMYFLFKDGRITYKKAKSLF